MLFQGLFLREIFHFRMSCRRTFRNIRCVPLFSGHLHIDVVYVCLYMFVCTTQRCSGMQERPSFIRQAFFRKNAFNGWKNDANQSIARNRFAYYAVIVVKEHIERTRGSSGFMEGPVVSCFEVQTQSTSQCKREAVQLQDKRKSRFVLGCIKSSYCIYSYAAENCPPC